MPPVIIDGDDDEPAVVSQPQRRPGTNLSQETQDMLEASLYGKRRVIPAAKVSNPENTERNTFTTGHRRTASEALGCSASVAAKPPPKKKKTKQPDASTEQRETDHITQDTGFDIPHSAAGIDAPSAVPSAIAEQDAAPQNIQSIDDDPKDTSKDASADLKRWYNNKHAREGKAVWDCITCK